MASVAASGEEIMVAVRVRGASVACLEVPGPSELVFTPPATGGASGNARARRFAFARVFGPSDDQAGIFDALHHRLLDSLLGSSPLPATVIAYGTTGAGKSHTLGIEPVGQPLPSGPAPAEGLLPRLARELFRRIEGAGLDTAGPIDLQVSCQFLEVAGDAVRDLLAPPSGAPPPLALREEGRGRVGVQGARSVPVGSAGDVIAALHFGLASRTALPDGEASRSHTLFIIHIQGPGTRTKLTLVDLAGSERATAGDRRSSTAVRARLPGLTPRGRDEAAAAANKGLLALGNVINALATEGPADGPLSLEALANAPLEEAAPADAKKGGWLSRLGGSFRKRSPPDEAAPAAPVSSSSPSASRFVPYRDSRLTRLLQDSLGGPCRTVFLACVSAAGGHVEETLRTLTYAMRVSRVRQRAVDGLGSASPLDAGLKAQLRLLDRLLSSVPSVAPIPPAPSDWLGQVGEDAAWVALVRLRRELEVRRGGADVALDAAPGSLTARVPAGSALDALRSQLEVARAESRALQTRVDQASHEAGTFRKGISAALSEVRALVSSGKAPAWVLARIERAVVRVIQQSAERGERGASRSTLESPAPTARSPPSFRRAALPNDGSLSSRSPPPTKRAASTLGRTSGVGDLEYPTARLYELLGLAEGDNGGTPGGAATPDTPLVRQGTAPQHAIPRSPVRVPAPSQSSKELTRRAAGSVAGTPDRTPAPRSPAPTTRAHAPSTPPSSALGKPKPANSFVSAFRGLTRPKARPSAPTARPEPSPGYAARSAEKARTPEHVPSYAAPTTLTLQRQQQSLSHNASLPLANIKGWIDIDLDSLSNVDITSPKANIYMGDQAHAALHPPAQPTQASQRSSSLTTSHFSVASVPHNGAADRAAHLQGAKGAEPAARALGAPAGPPLSARTPILTNRHSSLLAEVLDASLDGEEAAAVMSAVPFSANGVPPAPAVLPRASAEVMTARAHLAEATAQASLGAAGPAVPGPTTAVPAAPPASSPTRATGSALAAAAPMPAPKGRSSFKVSEALKGKSAKANVSEGGGTAIAGEVLAPPPALEPPPPAPVSQRSSVGEPLEPEPTPLPVPRPSANSPASLLPLRPLSLQKSVQPPAVPRASESFEDTGAPPLDEDHEMTSVPIPSEFMEERAEPLEAPETARGPPSAATMAALKGVDMAPARPPLMKADTRTALEVLASEEDELGALRPAAGHLRGMPSKAASMRLSQRENEPSGPLPKQKTGNYIVPSDILNSQPDDPPAFEPLSRIASEHYPSNPSQRQRSTYRSVDAPGPSAHPSEQDVGLPSASDYTAAATKSASANNKEAQGKLPAPISGN